MFVLTLFLFITLAMWGSAMTYFFDYVVPKDGSVVSFSTFNAVGQGVTFVAVATLPGILASRFGKKATFIVCLALTAAFTALFYFVSPTSSTGLLTLAQGKALGVAAPTAAGQRSSPAKMSRPIQARRVTSCREYA